MCFRRVVCVDISWIRRASCVGYTPEQIAVRKVCKVYIVAIYRDNNDFVNRQQGIIKFLFVVCTNFPLFLNCLITTANMKDPTTFRVLSKTVCHLEYVASTLCFAGLAGE